MTASLLALAIFSVVLFLLTKPMGLWMAPLAAGRAPLWAAGVDRWVLKGLGVAPLPQTWAQYAVSLFFFNAVGVVVLYLLLRCQGLLPLNPRGMEGVPPLAAFNIAVAFITGTDWQNYAGETTLSYFTQTVGLTVAGFSAAATGIAASFVVMRGFSQKLTDRVGNFWVDLTHIALWLLLPLAFLLAVFFVMQGVVQTYGDYPTVTTLAGDAQTIAVGPAASQAAIKYLGTNGGGFFGANAAHPFENPSQIVNFMSALASLLIAAGLTYTFGVTVRDTRQGWTVWGAMWVIFAAAMVGFAWFESETPQALLDLGYDPGLMNPEGKEVRFGEASVALFAIAMTAASGGAVNAMHDSFSPAAGLFPMWLMQSDEVVFGGVGVGFIGMMVFAVIGVFAAGLMVGRTPEYIGKRIEPLQMKLAVTAMLTPPVIVLVGTALTTLVPGMTDNLGNGGAQGFSEILYAWSSAAKNNGSAFAGLAVDNAFFNIGLAVAMWLGRFVPMVAMMALAGSLARQKTVAANAGTLQTYGLFFTVFLTLTVVLVGALTYVPALALGPVAAFVGGTVP